MRILIVEDTRSTAESFVEVFRAAGHQAESIGHSGKCLDTLARSRPDFRPDRLLVDASLPHDFLRKVLERFTAPVVGITSGAAAGDLPEGTTIIQKPAEPAAVLATLEAAGPH